MKFSTVAAFLGLASLSLAAPIDESLTARQMIVTVDIGADGTLLYDPEFIPYAGQGQIIHFDFHPKNHTFTESTEWRPCHKNGGGGTFDTDFNHFRASEDDAPKPFDITLADDSPRFFYCKQANFSPNGHCHKGMVFAVNVDADRFAAFKARADLDGLVQ